MKKKGGEDQDTKTSLIDDVYLQVCHVKKKNLICPMDFTVYLNPLITIFISNSI